VNWQKNVPVLDIIAPLGISFFTFQGLSYVFDSYRKKINKVINADDAFLYLSFFPLITAGPITRFNLFVEQLYSSKKNPNVNWQSALLRLCRGFFLKMVIADNMSVSVNSIFLHDHVVNPVYAWAGAIFFSIQVFCDFAGYSDIALGLVELMGFRLPENFTNPYLAAGISDFWRRWHISLTSWFRDYVFLPMSLSSWARAMYSRLRKTRFVELRTDLNIIIMFILSGLWHGPQWTFVIWGGIHGLAGVLEKHIRINWSPHSRWLAWINKGGMVFTTFLFVSFAWVPFASDSLSAAIVYWKSMFIGDYFTFPVLESIQLGLIWLSIFSIYLFLSGLKESKILPECGFVARIESLTYFAMILLISGVTTDFIYAKF
jgi:D-alanyl-lipoteichoic acid acyltransferase DltB (MBOAT superfamily)